MEKKFRVWDKKRKETLSSLWHVAIDSDGKLIILGSLGWEYPEDWNKRYEIMWYTGLKDKNGKEIYEGDILNGHMGKAIIEWYKSTARFRAKLIKPYKYVDYNGDMFRDRSEIFFDYSLFDEGIDEEIIGNIYENKDLLR